MMRILRLLRERRGATLAEMMVSAMLVCMAVLMIAAVISPATVAVRRLEELNQAQVIADNVLEVIRSELTGAQGYIKCYHTAADIAGDRNKIRAQGTAIEFRNEEGYAEIISAEGCSGLTIVRPSDTTSTKDGDEEKVPDAPSIGPGYLHMRYYVYNDTISGTDTFEYTNNTVRAVNIPYSERFYMGMKMSLYFEIDTSTSTVTVTVTVSRVETTTDDAGQTTETLTDICTEDLVVDLRYSPAFTQNETAQ